jgi:ATP-dependent Clp protease protease subunit
MRIVLNGEVGTDITLQKLWADIEKAPAGEPLDITLSSHGGSVLEGVAIYQLLKKESAARPVNMTGIGIVASIATVIFLAAKKEARKVVEGTKFLIHLPTGGAFGTADDIEKQAQNIRELENVMIEIYKRETSIPEDLLRKWLHEEHILSDDEMKAFGIVAEIERLEAVAKYEQNQKFGNMTIEQIKKMLGIAGAKAKVILDANEREINFPDVDETAEPKTGDRATIDGQPAQGEVILPDGTIYVFSDGVLIEIRKPDTQAPEENTDAAPAEVAELRELVKKLADKVQALTKENADLKAELLKVSAEHEAFLKAVKSKFELPKGGFDADRKDSGRGLQLLK